MKTASIVIPVYNAEDYIEECLKSALNQTYEFYDIIVINDGSTDKSWSILERYAKIYPNKIKVYNQKNAGVAITRNRGLQYSNCDYVFFMDNDDSILPDYIEKFVEAAEKSNADMVIGWHYQVEKGKRILRKLTDDKWSAFRFLTPWARTYRRDFLIKNGIEFLDTKMGEEIFCSMRAALATNNFIVLPYAGYLWKFNEQSVSHTLQKGFQKKASPLKMLNSLYSATDQKMLSPEKRDMFEYFYIKYCFWFLLDSGRHVGTKAMESEYNEILQLLNSYFPNWRKNRLLSFLKPKGESLATRIIVSSLSFWEKSGLTKFFYKLYSL